MNEAKYRAETSQTTFDFGTLNHSRYLKINYNDTLETDVKISTEREKQKKNKAKY